MTADSRARLRSVGFVFVGGCLGAAVRELLTLAFPARDGVPWTILTVNLVGAFLLGLLAARLATIGSEDSRARDLRLLLGTGVLGGFTTYSALATDTVRLLEHVPLVGVAYAVGSVVAGVAAAALGLSLGRRLGRRRAGGAA